MFLFFQQHALPWGASVSGFIILYDVLKGKRPNDFKSFELKKCNIPPKREYLQNMDIR